MVYLLNTQTGRVQTQEAWYLDLFDNYINKDTYENLLECDEDGEVLL